MNQPASRTPDAELSQFRVKGEIPVPALINGLTCAAVPLLVFFAWRSSGHGDPLTSRLLLAFAALLAINAIVFLSLGHKTLQRRAFITLIIALFTYLAIQAVEDTAAAAASLVAVGLLAIRPLCATVPLRLFISELLINARSSQQHNPVQGTTQNGLYNCSGSLCDNSEPHFSPELQNYR